jgi:hypothetical protein
MQKRLLEKQELSYVVIKAERDELGRGAPIHIVRTNPSTGTASRTACCRSGPYQFFLKFLWFMSKNPGVCRTCLEKAQKEMSPADGS